MPAEVQQNIRQGIAQKQAPVDTTKPITMKVNIAGQVNEQSPKDLYADLKAGMPLTELPKYYPEYSDNTDLINDLKADVDAGMPEEVIQQYYPELFTAVQPQEDIAGGGSLRGQAARQ